HAGTSIDSPNTPRATMANTRSQAAGSARACTAAPAIRVATVNDTASPSTTPRGRNRPAPAVVESTTGSTGSTQGDTTVATPARNTKPISSGVMASLYPHKVNTSAGNITGVLPFSHHNP